MRQPLWAINSSLLFLFLSGQAVFFVIKNPILRRSSLELDLVKPIEKKAFVVVDLKKIYDQNDLFDTFIPTSVAALEKIEQEIPAIPDAPAAIPLSIPIKAPKVFIAPLPVVLRGVMYQHDRPDKSIAIVQFQDSKEEINYKVGQLINDAQVLKIFANRVIVIRSNGQQETLYLREREALLDSLADMEKEIASMNILLKSGIYQIPVDKFVMQVKNLGQFIDLLDLTTVYQKGKSVGCRVGKAGKNSLGEKLGFVYDDVISQVGGLPVTDIASRVLVFDQIIEKVVGDKISVKVERGGKQVVLNYELIKSDPYSVLPLRSTRVVTSMPIAEESVNKLSVAPTAETLVDNNIEERRKKIFEQKMNMAPTARQIEMDERKKLFELRRNEMMARSFDRKSEFGNHLNGGK